MTSPDDPSVLLEQWGKTTEAATPGPWQAGHGGSLTGVHGDAKLSGYIAETWGSRADTVFIATARTAMPLLVAALKDVLKPHRPGSVIVSGFLCKRHENHRYFSISVTEADSIRVCPDCTATAGTSCAGCGPQVSADTCPVRAVVTRHLTGENRTEEEGRDD